MPPKADPYATRTQKRVDFFLLLFIAVIVALLLRPAAHGDAVLVRPDHHPKVQIDVNP